MKLSKSLVITGLLFSSVLGSVNVNSIVANAADSNIYQNKAAEDPLNKEIKVNVNYKLNGKNISIPGAPTSVSVSKDAKQVELKDLGTQLSVSSIKDGKTSFVIDSNNMITVELKDISSGQTDHQESNIKYTVNFIDEKANILKDSQAVFLNSDGKITLKDIKVPAGYEIVPNQSLKLDSSKKSLTVKVKKVVSEHVTVPNSKPAKPSKHSKPSRFVVQQVRISFINKTTGEEVGFQQLVGKDTFSTKIEAPKNYTFVNASDATVKFDKKGNKNIKVYVKQATPQITKHEGVVTTIDGHYKRLYNLEGQVIKSRALSANSAWYTDQFATINGETMYRVATNEWVKASDIK